MVHRDENYCQHTKLSAYMIPIGETVLIERLCNDCFYVEEFELLSINSACIRLKPISVLKISLDKEEECLPKSADVIEEPLRMLEWISRPIFERLEYQMRWSEQIARACNASIKHDSSCPASFFVSHKPEDMLGNNALPNSTTLTPF